MKLLALPLAVLAFHSSVQPLRPPLRTQIAVHRWHRGYPVPLSRLRVVSVSYWGFDRRVHSGRLVVNQAVASPLLGVFRKLYELRFHIHHMALTDAYGPKSAQPRDGDVTASFECRQAVPSPCTGGTGTGSWSEHAYGEAVDLNPVITLEREGFFESVMGARNAHPQTAA